MADLLEQLKAGLADRYQIEREIGRGAMATVYYAEDLKQAVRSRTGVSHVTGSSRKRCERQWRPNSLLLSWRFL